MAIKITPVDELPEVCGRRRQKNIAKYVKQFMDMDADVARIDFDSADYLNAGACASAFFSACTRWAKGKVIVQMRNDQVYLVKIG